MASFKVTLDNTIVAVMTQYAEQVRADLIQRLADKYDFDATEAMTFIQSGGIVVKYPPLDREKLPWTGDVRPECCKAIKKNSGLFTQCNGIVHTDDWCKPCAKEVAKKGKPTCGTVADRAACDVLEYQVGPFKVKPYVEYMKKQGIAREQVDKACDDYGIEIDPRQFEVKKRPRKPRDMATAVSAEAPSLEEEEDEGDATAATCTEVEEQLESDDEDDFEPPGTGITVATHGHTLPTPPEAEPRAEPTPTPAPTVLSVVEVTEPTPAPLSPVTAELLAEPMVAKLPTAAPLGSASGSGAPLAEITLAQIDLMNKATATAHCKARGIDTKSKGQVELKDALRASLK